MGIARRVLADVRAGRHLDTYVATTIAIVFAALGIIGDIVPENLKWAALFAGLGILLFRVTLPIRPGAPVDELLADRNRFADLPFTTLIGDAVQLWIFAPTAINVLNPAHCETIRKRILEKGRGDVRVVVLDPHNVAATDLAIRQLDESLHYPAQSFRSSLASSIERLQQMAGWRVAGRFAYGFIDYNPGFSLVLVNPTSRDGRLIVEFHGYRNEATGTRMHLMLTRADSDHWFQYWVHQFEEIWTAQHPPDQSHIVEPG